MKMIMGYYKAFFWMLSAFVLASCGSGGDSSVPLAGISANTLQLSLSSPTVTAAAPVTVTATVLSPTAAPVAGQPVQFSTQLGGLSATTATTNASGIATVTLTAGSVAGPSAVVAKFTDSSGNQRQVSQVFTTAGDAAGGTDPGTTPTVSFALNLQLLNAAGASTGSTAAPISASNPGTVKVTVMRNGVPQPNQIVKVASDLGTVSPSSGSALTDSSGVATLAFRAGNVEGAGTIVANFQNNEGSATASKTFNTLGDDTSSGSVSTGLKMTLVLRNQLDTSSITAITGAAPGLLKARLTDSANVPQAGKVVTFTTSLGDINPATGTALTDANGYALVNLSAGTLGGAGTARATFGTASADVSFTTDGSGGVSGSAGSLSSLGLFSASTGGVIISQVTSSQDGFYRVQARDSNGNGVPNLIITFTTDIGELSPSNGKALTNAGGVAVIRIKAGDSDGPGLVRASTSISGATFSDSQVLTVKQDELALGRGTGGGFVEGSLLLSTNSLPAGSTATVTANIQNLTLGTSHNTPVSVTFRSNCSLNNTAEIDSTIISQSGVATATYRGLTGCSSDVITAEAVLNGETRTAQVTLTVLAAPPSSISFVNADPMTIAIKGTGGSGRLESSDVVFEVRNAVGAPVGAGVAVNFSLNTLLGGLSFSNGLGTDSAVTDVAGRVKATVLAGTVPTPVRVTARLAGAAPQPETVSDALSVSTGLPVQNAFSVAVSVSNPSPAAGSHDGTTVAVTARAADHFNNPVPNGTVIQFISELGLIGPQCQTQNGACSVDWVSSGARSARYDPARAGRTGSGLTSDQKDLQGLKTQMDGIHDRYGRSTILAYAVGEESFIDANTNNRYDNGEVLFANLPEAFRDDNENGIRDNDETFIDFNENGSYSNAAAFDGGVTPAYNGTLCTAAAAVNHCKSLVNVRSSNVIVLSTERLQLYIYADSPNVDFTNFAWTAPGGGAPSAWASTVATGTSFNGVLTAPYLAIAANGEALRLSQAQLSTSAAVLSVLLADLNGNAPAVGATVTLNPGSARAVGLTTCTVESRTEPKWCRFVLTGPDTPPTAVQPVTLTVKSGAEEFTRTIGIQ